MKGVEIFQSGKREDSNGQVREWTGKDLDIIAQKYNSSSHEAPLVIGHPKDNSPAWGWIDKTVRRVGDKLIADFKDVIPDFQELVKTGMYKKRSVSLYPDLTLRHVGFLGGKPPAVKGLKDIQFSEEEQIIIINFEEIGGNEMDEKDKEIQELKTKLSEFSEKERTKDEEIASLKQELVKKEQEARKKEFNDFCEKHIEKITPANKNDIADFMEVMHNAGSFDFAEGTEKNVLQRFKNFIEKLPGQIEFSEIATKDKAADKKPVKSSEFSEMNVDDDRLLLDAKATKISKDLNISYSEAVKHALKEV